MPRHESVLRDEVVAALDLRPGAEIIDGTIGDGGHSEAILEELGGQARVLGIDLDSKAIGESRSRLGRWGRAVTIVQGNFRDIDTIAAFQRFRQPTAILLDLGLRSAELEESGLGFSFRKDEPLVMRFDGRTDPPTAASLLNGLSREQLTRVFREYGEEPNADRAAAAIVTARKRKKIITTRQLVEILEEALPPAARRGRIHFATRVFQALRIATNDELGSLREVLPKARDLLASGGRLAVISFQSLEDRIVKTAFRDWQRQHFGTAVTKKPLTPTPTETIANLRSRSAKLRVFQKI